MRAVEQPEVQEKAGWQVCRVWVWGPGRLLLTPLAETGGPWGPQLTFGIG